MSYIELSYTAYAGEGIYVGPRYYVLMCTLAERDEFGWWSVKK